MQLDIEGNLTRAVSGSLPSFLPQSATFAEHVVALRACSFVQLGGTVVVDCQGLLTSHLGGHAVATSACRATAGLWLSYTGRHLFEMQKTKAHRTLDEAQACGDSMSFHGNRLADLHAKAVAQAVSRHDEQDIVQYQLNYKLWFQRLGMHLSSFPGGARR